MRGRGIVRKEIDLPLIGRHAATTAIKNATSKVTIIKNRENMAGHIPCIPGPFPISAITQPTGRDITLNTSDVI
jgi:hypothetical protein